MTAGCSPESRRYNLFGCRRLETCCYGTFCTVCQVGESASQAELGTVAPHLVSGRPRTAQARRPLLGSLMASGFLANLRTARRSTTASGTHRRPHAVFVDPACLAGWLAGEAGGRWGQPVDVLGHITVDCWDDRARRQLVLFPTAPVMVRTAQPPRECNIMNGEGRRRRRREPWSRP